MLTLTWQETWNHSVMSWCPKEKVSCTAKETLMLTSRPASMDPLSWYQCGSVKCGWGPGREYISVNLMDRGRGTFIWLLLLEGLRWVIIVRFTWCGKNSLRLPFNCQPASNLYYRQAIRIVSDLLEVLDKGLFVRWTDS